MKILLFIALSLSLSPFVQNFLQPLLIHGLADVVIHTLSGRQKKGKEMQKGKSQICSTHPSFKRSQEHVATVSVQTLLSFASLIFTSLRISKGGRKGGKERRERRPREGESDGGGAVETSQLIHRHINTDAEAQKHIQPHKQTCTQEPWRCISRDPPAWHWL